MKKNNIIQIIIFFSLIIYLSSFSQPEEYGTPIVENFHPKKYGYESQNFSIIQDKKGFLYFGNVSGILQYDGINWNLIDVVGIPRFASDDEGNVYVGAFKDFGIITTDEKNNYVFKSLIKEVKKKELIGEVNEIVAYKNEILMINNKGYIISYKNNKIRIIDSSGIYSKFFKIKKSLYIYKESKGIYQYKDGNLYEWLSSAVIKDKVPEFLIPYKNDYLIKFYGEPKIYILTNEGVITHFNNEIEFFLEENKYSCNAILNDTLFFFGTLHGGVTGINIRGKAFLHLSSDNFLLNDWVNALFIDKWNNLWLALNNGISRVEINSAFTYFTTVDGVKGGIGDIKRFNNLIFIATTQGLRYLNPDYNILYLTSKKFIPIKEIQYTSHKLLSTDKYLLITTTNGIFALDKKLKVKKIYGGFAEPIFKLNDNADSILVGLSNGLGLIVINNNGKFNFYRLKSNSIINPRTIARDGYDEFWIGTDYNGVYKVKINFEEKSYTITEHYYKNYGLPQNFGWLDVYNISTGILFSTQKGVFRYNPQKKIFYLDTLFSKSYNKWFYPIVEDKNKNIWFSTGTVGAYEKRVNLLYLKRNGTYKKINEPFKVLSDYNIESIFPDKDAVVWFGSFDILIRFDAKKLTQDTCSLFIYLTSIIAGNDTFSVVNLTEPLKIKYKNNNITFKFISPYFTSENKPILYQYYLQGFDSKWSNWSLTNVKEYTNLPEGDYIFYVRSKNIFGTISPTLRVPITIKPPLYRTIYAYICYILFVMFLILTIIQWRTYVNAKEKREIENELNNRTKELAEQKEKVEMLIRNILPEDTIHELSEKGKITNKKYKMVSILFSDVKGFTELASRFNPDELFNELNIIFNAFDKICEQHYIEKIKTIGDAYMCAGGIPMKNRTNPIDIVLAALKMQEFVISNRDKFKFQWQIRIGIHTGEVIAGVIGTKKFTYDIWGDAVNIASRMESTSEANEINISQATYEKVSEFFICEHRGKLPVKYKGQLDMYFVKGIKPKYSLPNDPTTPNKTFLLKIQFYLYEDLEELIINQLEKALPGNLYYHNVRHTLDVITQTEILSIGEKVTLEERLLLKTAALFHDYGFIYSYDDHEEISAKYAREILPKYRYNSEQIDIICELILSTKFDHTPKNKLEMILRDADLDYLGREDYIPISYNLFRELHERGKIKTYEEWTKLQYDFILHHEYYTETARKIREARKLENLNTFQS